MAKTVDMSGWDEFSGETLEEYVNKQGCTLGSKGKLFQDLHRCMAMCYIHGLVTDSQAKHMSEKFAKKFQKSLHEM